MFAPTTMTYYDRKLGKMVDVDKGFRKSMRDFFRPGKSMIAIKEASGVPLTDVQPRPHDPVYNIAMQNPIAQPGGGAAQFVRQRTDLAEIHGIISKQPSQTTITVYSDRPNIWSPYMKSLQTDQNLHTYYFNGGTVANGGALKVANAPHQGDKQILMKDSAPRKCKNSLRVPYLATRARVSTNSVTYGGTALPETLDEMPVSSVKKMYLTDLTKSTTNPYLGPNQITSAAAVSKSMFKPY